MSEISERKDDNSSVRVAVRVRPQNAKERIDMCQVCTSIMGGEPQIQLGKDKSFTFDHVYDMETDQESIYNTCVRHLIDGCFDGYNATVFAYGQTGAGKTYSMGTGFDLNSSEEEIGIIPRGVDHLFQGIKSRRTEAFEKNEPPPDFKVNAQFMELYNEEILDLLDTTRDPESRGRKSHIKIHEDAGGEIYVVGVTTRHVTSLEDTIQCLKIGSLSRATASTNMNVQSSRSHAIFTLHIKQHRMVKEEAVLEDDKDTDSTQSVNEFETLTAKFHFVDLAGSERLKRTGATGDRAKEGISINCGLLALGNVISALGDKLKKGCHVPYRDSKLTRLLQDSLGGNSRTLMIACISPSDRDFMETLNTLKYANRARNIRNKVIANQDKASKQMAALRTEIAALQNELAEYKTGKRMVDADGEEVVSDMHHENSMLLTENDKLRHRVKTLGETIKVMKTRNEQLLAEKALFSVRGENGEINKEEVTKLITDYVKQLEDLRCKLTESEANVKVAQNAAHSPSRMTMSAMSTLQSGSLDYPITQDNSITSILEVAKKDVKKMKKLKRSRSRQSNQGSDKENEGDEEDERPRTGDVVMEIERAANDLEHEESQEKSEDEQEEEDDDNIDDEEDTTEDSVSSSDSESDGKDTENIHEDLAELTCDISIKQKLIEELESSQRKIHAMKRQYEEKVIQLQYKIKETELERDKVLANVGQVESESVEKQKKVKDDYSKKLNDLQLELKKMQAAKREHAKMVRNQSHYEKQLKTYQQEVQDMKRTKVRLMKQIKEDGEKNKQSEERRNKEIAQMKREFTRKESMIRSLEREKNQKEQVLKRKQEEVEALRKRQKTLSSKAAGRVGKYEKAPTIPRDPLSSSSRRRRHREFSSKVAKQKWDAIEKRIVSSINKRQTIVHMGKDMDVWLKQRERNSKKLEKFIKRRETCIQLEKGDDIIKVLNDQIVFIENQIKYIQGNINDCQANIMQVEESKDEYENINVEDVSFDEAKYLLKHFLQLSIDKGMAKAQCDSELKEMTAKLHQTEQNNRHQQDLLKHMMIDHVDIEIDNLMSNNDELDESEIDSLTSSASPSPAESMFETVPYVFPGPPPSGGSDLASKKQKARRKASTPMDLLYGGRPAEDSSPLLPFLRSPPSSVDDDVPPLCPVREEVVAMPVNDVDTILMPPPKSQGQKTSSLPRPTSAKPADPRPSPRLRRKELRNSPEPTPVLQNAKHSERVSSRSTDTMSDSTPPSSPHLVRRSTRNGDEDVFSRLTVKTQGSSRHTNREVLSDVTTPTSPTPSRRSTRGSDESVNNVGTIPPPVRGTISASKSRPASGASSPLTCSHTAEGHTRAVLAVDATDDHMFTGSKDCTAKMWDLATGKEVLAFSDHHYFVSKVKHCPSSKLTFTVAHKSIQVWDVRDNSPHCIQTLGSSGLSTSGQSSQTHQSRLSDQAQRDHSITDIALGNDGVSLYSAAGNIVRVWDLRKYNAVGKLSAGNKAQVLVFVVDGSSESKIVVTGSMDHYITVFEVPKDAAGVFTPKYNLEPPHYDGIQSLALQGSTLFSGSRDMCIKKWDLKEQQLKQSINSAHKQWVTALDFMPTGDFLVSACRSGLLKLWKPDTCSQVAEIKAHSTSINAISINSTHIFTASSDKTVAFWKQQTYVEPSDSSDLEDERQSVGSS